MKPFSLADASGIASMYLAIVGILCSMFLINLSSWLSTIQALHAKWSRLAITKNDIKQYDQRLDVFFGIKQAGAGAIVIGWFIVAAFTWGIVFFQYEFQQTVEEASRGVVMTFVTLPCFLFAILFSIASVGMLWYGYSKIKQVLGEMNGSV